jgi:hypothetical protein
MAEEDMDPIYLAAGGALFGCVVTWIIMRERYDAGKLAGIEGAMYELSRGASNHYEEEGKEIPKDLAKVIDEMVATVKSADTVPKKIKAREIYMWNVGNEIGRAAHSAGFEHGERYTDPRNKDVRVDLAPRELAEACWLSHRGFQSMMPSDAFLAFKTKEEAQRATHLVEKLERHLTKEFRREDDPRLPVHAGW